MVRKALMLTALVSARAVAQADSTRPKALDPVVVTADRVPGALRSSVSAVTRISAATLARMPRATLADVLRAVPGFTVVDFDGLGFDPQLMARGFYGGGEAEYAVVLVDGKPLNQLQTGTVSWDMLPPAASIEAVEVVRGAASSLYGDAAIAAVVNVITHDALGPRAVRWDAGGGTFGTYHAAADVNAPSWHRATLSGGFDRTSGFRDHAERQVGRAHASLGLFERPDARVSIGVDSRWRAFDEPGAQLASLAATGRGVSDPLFRFDHTKDQDHAVSVDASKTFHGDMRLTSYVTGEMRSTDAIRTLALAPGFGDTKERDAAAGRFAGHVQLDLGNSPIPGDDRIVVGGDGTYGELRSRYYLFAGGPRSAYATAAPARGALDTDTRSARAAGALYADYNARPVSAVRLTLGGRVDHITDDVRSPSDAPTATHTAFSPKAGVNIAYLGSERATGNFYATVSRSFKAPTLDQLYDLRNVPVPFPPFKIHTSNPDLRPQYGVNVEGGLYQRVDVAPGLQLDGTVSAFQIDMTDELDFDIQSFKYVNIGKSRHRGVEGGANLTSGRWSLNGVYTLQDARSRSGDFAGHRLKAIPRHTLGGGLSLRPTRLLETSLYTTNVRGIYLDDANTVALPNYTRVDARVSVAFGARQLFVDARNLLDAKYSTSGFMDPSGSGQQYLYPAAGRVLEVGVRGTGW